jgi:undecaprenyl diphosphate synthase
MPNAPRHVAIIMDGNGRWAQARQLDRLQGHQAGADTVRRITTRARECGVESLTLYAFSTENWQRPKTEVAGLWTLLVQFLKSELPTLLKNRIGLCLIGDPGPIPKLAQRTLNSVIERTTGNTKMTLNLALNYGAKAELMNAFGELVKSGEPLDEDHLERHLYTAGQAPVDLLIRTGGEHRLSNFLLWQAAYAELYFVDTLWPDYTADNFDQALDDFAGRERRFGLTSAQLRKVGP